MSFFVDAEVGEGVLLCDACDKAVVDTAVMVSSGTLQVRGGHQGITEEATNLYHVECYDGEQGGENGAD